jgi:hypothetical protein
MALSDLHGFAALVLRLPVLLMPQRVKKESSLHLQGVYIYLADLYAGRLIQ